MADGELLDDSSNGPGDLVAKVLAGDEEASALLVGRFSRPINDLAERFTGNALDAQDLSQEIWARVHRGLKGLKDAEAFSPWLWRTASRVCLDYQRRSMRPTAKPHAIEAPSVADGADVLVEHEESQIAWQALNALSGKQRMILFLREIQGLDYRAIGAALGMSVNSVGVNLLRARRALAATFKRLDVSPAERCDQSRHVMAGLLDGEGDFLARRSLSAHLQSCPTCRAEYRQLRRASKKYRALPPPPLEVLQAPVLWTSAWTRVAGSLGVALQRAKSLVAAPVAGTAFAVLVSTAAPGAHHVAQSVPGSATGPTAHEAVQPTTSPLISVKQDARAAWVMPVGPGLTNFRPEVDISATGQGGNPTLAPQPPVTDGSNLTQPVPAAALPSTPNVAGGVENPQPGLTSVVPNVVQQLPAATLDVLPQLLPPVAVPDLVRPLTAPGGLLQQVPLTLPQTLNVPSLPSVPVLPAPVLNLQPPVQVPSVPPPTIPASQLSPAPVPNLSVPPAVLPQPQQPVAPLPLAPTTLLPQTPSTLLPPVTLPTLPTLPLR